MPRQAFGGLRRAGWSGDRFSLPWCVRRRCLPACGCCERTSPSARAIDHERVRMDLIFVGFFATLALAIGLYVVSVPQDGQKWWGLAAVIIVLVIAGKLIGDSWVSSLCLDLAELAAVALVWSHGTPEAAAAGRKYLYSIVPAITCTLIAGSLIGTGAEAPGSALQKLVVGLLIIGFALKLGLIPFYFWLPAVASAAPAMTTALIVS